MVLEITENRVLVVSEIEATITSTYYFLNKDLQFEIQRKIEGKLEDIIDAMAKELKEEKIMGDVVRWWAYFGGSDTE